MTTDYDNLKLMLENANIKYVEYKSSNVFYIGVWRSENNSIDFSFDETGNMIEIHV
jgi:hypothetical protein